MLLRLLVCILAFARQVGVVSCEDWTGSEWVCEV
jgi:hypothetical protein